MQWGTSTYWWRLSIRITHQSCRHFTSYSLKPLVYSSLSAGTCSVRVDTC